MTGCRQMAILLALGMLSACGGGDDGSSSDPTVAAATSVAAATTIAPDTVPPTSTLPAVPASANPIDQGVEVKFKSDDFDAITTPIDVVTGDRVRTDASGFAEVVYPDGSLTRLDVDTDFEIVTITDAAGSATTRTSLETGRVWNRVKTLGSEEEFSLETSVATATVRGTAFLVECRQPNSCTFTALEGSVEIVVEGQDPFLLVAPNSVTVDSAGVGDVVPVAFDAAFSDPWVADNAVRDVAAGYPSAAQMYEVHGPAFGALSGTFTGEATVVAVECLETPTCDGQEDVGSVKPRTYVFSVDCSSGFPCVGQSLTQFSQGNEVLQDDVPLTFDGTTARWTLARDNFQCSFDDGTQFGSLTYIIEWTLTPVAAEIRDDKYSVTSVTIDIVATNTVIAAPECGNLRSFRQSGTATATRTA